MAFHNTSTIYACNADGYICRYNASTGEVGEEIMLEDFEAAIKRGSVYIKTDGGAYEIVVQATADGDCYTAKTFDGSVYHTSEYHPPLGGA